MNDYDIKKFERFLLDSFEDGIQNRELRLSEREVIYLKEKFPDAKVQKCLGRVCTDGKEWYEVILVHSSKGQNESVFSKVATIQKENIQLKQELDHLKKFMSLAKESN